MISLILLDLDPKFYTATFCLTILMTIMNPTKNITTLIVYCEKKFYKETIVKITLELGMVNWLQK